LQAMTMKFLISRFHAEDFNQSTTVAMQRLTSLLGHPNLRGLPVEYASAIRWHHQWHQKHTEPFTGFAQQRRHYNILFPVNIMESEQTVCQSAKRSCGCVCMGVWVCSCSSACYALNMVTCWHAVLHFVLFSIAPVA
jgi:hypothetical protein